MKIPKRLIILTRFVAVFAMAFGLVALGEKWPRVVFIKEAGVAVPFVIGLACGCLLGRVNWFWPLAYGAGYAVGAFFLVAEMLQAKIAVWWVAPTVTAVAYAGMAAGRGTKWLIRLLVASGQSPPK